MTPAAVHGAEHDIILSTLRGGATACIIGPPGAGKSTLANRVLGTLGDALDPVLIVRGTAALEGSPLGALIAAIGPSLSTADSPAEAAADALADVGLLIVDDLHLLDQASAEIVATAISDGTPTLAMWRAERLTAPSINRALAVAEATTVTVGPLSETDVETLVTAQLGGSATRMLVRESLRITGGNPLFIHLLIDCWKRDGALHAEGGTWVLGQGAAAPGDLSDTVTAELRHLSEPELRALMAVALSEPVELGVLEVEFDPSVLESLEAADLIALVRRGSAELLRLGHPLYGDAVRRVLPPAQIASVAAALANSADLTTTDPVTVGRWLLEAAKHRPQGNHAGPGSAGELALPETAAGGLLTRAAETARLRMGHALASELASAAIDLGAGPRADLVLAEVEFQTGHQADAIARLEVLAKRDMDDESRALIANAHAHVLSQVGRDSEAWAVLESAGAQITDPEARTPLALRAGILQVFGARGADAVASSRGLLDHPTASVRGRAAYAAAIGLALTGEPDAAYAVAEIGCAAFAEFAPAPEVVLIGAAVAAILAGDVQRAKESSRRIAEAMISAGDREGEATGSMLLGRSALLAGEPEAATVEFRRCLAVNRQLEDHIGVRWSQGGLLHARALAGDADEVALLLADLDADTGNPTRLFEADLVQRGRAAGLILLGQQEAATALLASQAESAIAEGQPAVAALLLHDALCVSDNAEWDARLRDLPRGADLAEAAASARRRTSAPKLSPRQWDIARRARDGASSKDIAAELHLSVRTVENHLAAIYRALGVKGRSGLSAALEQ